MHERLKAIINHISGSKVGVAGVYNRALYAEEKRDALERYAKFIDDQSDLAVAVESGAVAHP